MDRKTMMAVWHGTRYIEIAIYNTVCVQYCGAVVVIVLLRSSNVHTASSCSRRTCVFICVFFSFYLVKDDLDDEEDTADADAETGDVGADSPSGMFLGEAQCMYLQSSASA